MPYAHVVLDIPTRALSGAFDYLVPDELADKVQVGTTVLVSFSRRPCIGYVVAVTEHPASGVTVDKVLPVKQVLAPSAFDLGAARVASWMAREYACPPCEALRPFLAPGQLVKVKRDAEDAPWQLQCERSGPVDARWVSLASADEPYEPRRNAARQRAVLAALSAGPVRMAELSATIPGAGQAVAALERRGAVVVETRRRVRGGEDTSLSSAHAPRPAHLTSGQRAALAAISMGERTSTTLSISSGKRICISLSTAGQAEEISGRGQLGFLSFSMMAREAMSAPRETSKT